MDNLEKFVNDFLDGKLEPYLKSEPVPASNDEPVKVRSFVSGVCAALVRSVN